MGYDSDHPRAEGEVGKVGVAIDSLDDMRLLMADLPMDKVTTSMTINATGAILLLLYQLVAEEQGVAERQDPRHHPERHLEGVHRPGHLHLPAPAVDAADHRHLLLLRRQPPQLEHHLHFRLPHPRGRLDGGAGDRLHPGQRHRLRRGGHRGRAWTSTSSRPGCRFFWNAHNNLFEEVAKYRAARRMWARIMTERFGAKDERSKMLRFHTQTGGSTLTAQQPENNIVRVTLQSLAAVLGGHPEPAHQRLRRGARACPPTRAAKIALRTQQIVGFESGVADTVDPLAGSYFVESLTDEVEAAAQRVPGPDRRSWAARWPPSRPGSCRRRSRTPPTASPRRSTTARRSSSASTASPTPRAEPTEVFPIDVKLQQIQIDRTRSVRAERDQAAVDRALADVAETARGEGNLLVPMKAALKQMATSGEVSDVLRAEFGVYQPGG